VDRVDTAVTKTATRTVWSKDCCDRCVRWRTCQSFPLNDTWSMLLKLFHSSSVVCSCSHSASWTLSLARCYLWRLARWTFTRLAYLWVELTQFATRVRSVMLYGLHLNLNYITLISWLSSFKPTCFSLFWPLPTSSVSFPRLVISVPFFFYTDQKTQLSNWVYRL